MRTSDIETDTATRREEKFAGRECRGVFDFHLTGTGAVAEVEQKLRSWYGADYALCVSNATDALRAVGLAIGLTRREFITTPLTWGGSIAEWLRLGNRPRFVALEPLTLTISPASVRAAITPKTRAILAVDIFGNPADIKALRALADEYNLWLIVDAAQSLGARRDGLTAGSLADAWVVSFGIGKGVDAGDGGAILTNRRDLYEKLLWETQHPARQRMELGLSLDNEFASNSRMNPWTAMWLSKTFDAQLKSLRDRQATLLHDLRDERLCELAWGAASISPTIEPSFHRVVLSWRTTAAPDDLLAMLRAAGWIASIEPIQMRLLFEQPSYVARYLRRSSGLLDRDSFGIDLSRYFCIALQREGSTR